MFMVDETCQNKDLDWIFPFDKFWHAKMFMIVFYNLVSYCLLMIFWEFVKEIYIKFFKKNLQF